MAEDRNLLNKIVDKAKATTEGLKRQYGIGQSNNTWPQTKYISELRVIYPTYRTKGFLPPTSLFPTTEYTIDTVTTEESINFGGEERLILGSESEEDSISISTTKKVKGPPILKEKGDYKYIDWRGHMIKPMEDKLLSTGNIGIDTNDRFNISKNIPKTEDEKSDILNKGNPYYYSIRDTYLIFGDTSTDYFKHGLQVIDNKNQLIPIEKIITPPTVGISTPFENTDPIIYGFEIIIDDISSPLLNGSIGYFLSEYSNVGEISSRIPVYEEFKQQFIKFFKTKATVRIEDLRTPSITKLRGAETAETDSNKEIFQTGKKSYMSYYIKKITGLEKLVESNTTNSKKFITEYNKDTITIGFTEDVSMSVGTLAHLYKLMYWSKPNGKGIIPENLLRFNCDIIVSEVRNFNRVKEAVDTGEIQIIKDNVSRYIYSLKECQFYFNTMPHSADIDMGTAPTTFDGYSVQFDYKYSTVKFERFVPTQNGSGQYIGYDSGSIWRKGQGDNVQRDIPKFFTTGLNSLSQNGVEKDFVLSRYGTTDNPSKSKEETSKGKISSLQRFKENSSKAAKKLANRLVDTAINSATRELQSAVNLRVALLNISLNKILESKANISRIGPPRNIYKDSTQSATGRIFYDVRSDLLNFLGSSFGTQIGRSTQTIVTPSIPFNERRVATVLYLDQIRKIGNVVSRRAYGSNVFQSKEQPFSNVGFPSSAQKFPAPVDIFKGNLKFVRESNTTERSSFGASVHQSKEQPFSRVGFPNYAQKFPAPVYISSGADDIAPGTFIIGPGGFTITG